jgi:hypothetical protein
LQAERDPRNRFWKQWWIIGEALRRARFSRKAQQLPR